MYYQLLADGVNLLYKSNKITWSAESNTTGATLSFESYHSLRMGQIVNFFIDGYECFRGVIVKCNESKLKYTYTCFDYAFYLKNEVVVQFNKVDITSGLSSLLLEHDIKHAIVNIPTKIDKFYAGESIIKIIDDMIDMAMNDQGLYYFRELRGNMLYLELNTEKYINPSVVILDDINIDYSIENVRNKILVMSRAEKATSVIAEAYDDESKWWYGLLQKVEKVDDKELAQAKNIADNMLTKLNKVEHSTTVRVLVLERAELILPHRLIYFNNKKLKGWYRIRSVSHDIVNGRHIVDIGLEW